MNKTHLKIFAIISILLSFSMLNGQKLDERLKLLAPLIHKNWQGNMPRFGKEAKREVRWDVLWNGKALKQVTEVKKLNFTTETYYFWDADRQEIGLFSLSSNGNFLHGHVKKDNGHILMYGMATYGKLKIKFRNTFELTEKGTLMDRWFTFRDGEWKPGHSFELSAAKE